MRTDYSSQPDHAKLPIVGLRSLVSDIRRVFSRPASASPHWTALMTMRHDALEEHTLKRLRM